MPAEMASKPRHEQAAALTLRRCPLAFALVSAFVYRLGRGLLKAEGRVRFPYALPISFLINRINGLVSCKILHPARVLKYPSISSNSHFGDVLIPVRPQAAR